VRRLVAKVPTQWGSESNRPGRLKDAIEDLTSVPRYGCDAYRPSPKDWDQLNGLKNILNVSTRNHRHAIQQRLRESKVVPIKRSFATTAFQVADIYETFEELDVSLKRC
jgi:hypothetical protein